MLISAVIHAQFPANHPELLLGKEIKVIELDSTLHKYGYRNFYVSEDLKFGSNYSKENAGSSKYEKLVGKIFTVSAVIPYKNSIGEDKFKLKLENAETGTLYFDYDPRFEYHYVFDVIGGLKLPEGIYCEDIETTTDKFTGEIKSVTPYSEGVRFIKVVKDGKTSIYFTMNETGSTPNVGKTGLILLLENGKRIDRPAEPIDVKVNEAKGGSPYVYSVFMLLTPTEINLLKENAITDNRLYIYDGTIENGKKLKEYLICLTK